jgi:radical SAM-linked protein
MRIRITFAKTGALRYIGHLDLHKMWERAARRANLPLSYSQGFHPSPKIQLAAALPLGFSSRCELVDLWVEGEIDLKALPEGLQHAVPAGLKILSAGNVDEKSPPLQTQVVSAEYEVTLPTELDLEGLTRSLSAIMEAESLPRERRGKPYDLRPLIEELALASAPLSLSGKGAGGKDATLLFMRLTAREGATGRPEEVLSALGYGDEGWRVERSRLIFKEAV